MPYPTLAQQMPYDNSALICAEGHSRHCQYDSTVPDSLRRAQEWMARNITAPLNAQYRLALDAQGRPAIQEEACQWLRASPFLAPHQCLELYSQQYWWRLLRILEQQYPLTRRILGGELWNTQVAVPYLAAHPPRHWSLYTIDDRLLDYLQCTPCGAHPAFTFDAARLDYAYLHVLHLPQSKPLPSAKEEHELEALLSSTIYTQPHLFLLTFPGDLFAFRKEVLEVSEDKKDYYLHTPLPSLELKDTARYFVLFRQHDSTPTHVELSAYAARYLRQFLTGSSIEQSLEWVETQEAEMQHEVQTHLMQWLQEWIAQGWFTLEAPHAPYLRIS